MDLKQLEPNLEVCDVLFQHPANPLIQAKHLDCWNCYLVCSSHIMDVSAAVRR